MTVLLHEVLQLLRGEGYVVFSPNKGARVRPIDYDFVRNIYEISALIEPALTLTSKGGTCVMTAVANMMESEVSLNSFMFAMMNKELKGCLFGSGNPRADIPMLLSMYREGQLKLDELVTKTYTLDQINEGYQDMRDGKNIRGVIVF